MTTETTPQIYRAISAVMADIGAVGKDSTNEIQKYKFRGIDALLNAAHPAMVKHGVFCVPQVMSTESAPFMSKSGTPSFRVTTIMKYIFYGPDGSSIEAIVPSEGIDTSDKATNKTLSAALKYALIQIFSIPTADMDDADSANPEAGAPAYKGPQTTAPKAYVKKSDERSSSAGGGGEAGNTVRGESTPASPITPDKGRAVSLHRKFREALKPEFKQDADSYLKAFLQRNKIVDHDGRPSTLAIKPESFDDVETAALEYAKQVNSGNSN